MVDKNLIRRIIEISYKHKLSHLGSCLTAVGIIDEIFSKKSYDERFILSSGHAGLALYVVLEKYGKPLLIDLGEDLWTLKPLNAEQIFNHHGVHPDNCFRCGIDASSGSLGHGLGMALGMALADRSKKVYCLISDGECAEGSIWEALAIKEKYQVKNLIIHANLNGYGAYDPVDRKKLTQRLRLFCPDIIFHNTDANYKYWPGLAAHYHVMNKNEYEKIMKELK